MTLFLLVIITWLAIEWSPFTVTSVTVLGGIIGAIITQLGSKRLHSGQIRVSPADVTWDNTQRLIDNLYREVERQDQQIEAQDEEIKMLRAEVKALRAELRTKP